MINILLRRTPVKTAFQLISSKPAEPPAAKSPQMKPPDAVRAGRGKRLEDENSVNFVPIKSAGGKRRVLTDHQKDKMTSRHDDIPALYSDLSRDDSIIPLPSQVIGNWVMY